MPQFAPPTTTIKLKKKKSTFRAGRCLKADLVQFLPFRDEEPGLQLSSHVTRLASFGPEPEHSPEFHTVLISYMHKFMHVSL
jgi:hypothetical protein